MTAGYELIIAFIVNTIYIVFVALDSVYFPESSFTVLDIFIAILFLDVVIYFIIKLIFKEDEEENEEVEEDNVQIATGGYARL